MNPDGDMREGWLDDNGQRYYLFPDSGEMATGGPHIIDGETHYFNNNGAWIPA